MKLLATCAAILAMSAPTAFAQSRGTPVFDLLHVNGVSTTAGITDSVGITTPSLTTTGIVLAGAGTGNQVGLHPGVSGVSPFIQAQGIDANLDLQLIPKGTGVIRTYVGSVLRAYHLSERADLNGGTVWSSGTSAEGVSNFFNAGGVSGTTASGDASVNYFAIASDSLDCHLSAGGLCSGLELNHNFGGAAARGSRTGIGGILNLTSTTGGVGGSYVAGQFTMQANVNDGGISGTEHSSVFGINAVAALTNAAATFFSQLVGSEIDVYGVTGSSVKDKIGQQIVETSVDAVTPTRDNVAFSINNQSSAVGWQYGVEFGRSGGNFPITSTGTLIYGQGLGGIGFSAANGIDWHLGTFSGSFLKDAHFNLLGNGEFAMAKITDPATAPGAAVVKITAEAGTTGGTCKLVARAGTSTTATTILDNIGTGC